MDQQLDQLVSSGLIGRVGATAELEYLFRHALVQDAAYNSLLRADRRRLHQAVGAILEQAYTGNLAEIAPLLAEHFAQAGDDPRALQYYSLAADTAAARYANVEALAHYAQALEIAYRSEAPAEAIIG